ncbi:MAG: energy transducer TonB [Flavobacteriales bacterium]
MNILLLSFAAGSIQLQDKETCNRAPFQSKLCFLNLIDQSSLLLGHMPADTTIVTEAPDSLVESPMNSNVEMPDWDEQDDSILVNPEVPPSFPGGNSELFRYIKAKTIYPASELAKKVQGTVYIEFVVEKSGAITNIRAVKEIKNGPGLALEAMRIVKLFPNWTPAQQNGNNVRSKSVIPFTFKID